FAFGWCFFTGVPFPLVMALIVAFFDLIPQIGATIASILVTLCGLSVSLGLGLSTLAFFCVYQAAENWFFYPRLMGRAVEITALGALTSAMIGAALLGVLGVIIAVPLYASASLIVREVVFPRQDAH